MHTQLGLVRDEASKNLLVELQEYKSKWFFSNDELESNSPSRKDGIDWQTESQLRKSYCLFIQNMGMELRVPQLTIATAFMFCHRFYLCQSHTRNSWQIIATACMFLASKVEETPCSLDKVVTVGYRMTHAKDPVALQKFYSKEVFMKQRDLILVGERLLLSTIGFDMNIHHPYKPLVAAAKKLRLQNDVVKYAWNFINDWLQTSLCLQYKPHYIAAGSLYLAAKLNNVQLSSQKGFVWWHEFDVAPQRLQEVNQYMINIVYKESSIAPRNQVKNTSAHVVAKDTAEDSPESCVMNQASSSGNLSAAKTKLAHRDPSNSFSSTCKNDVTEVRISNCENQGSENLKSGIVNSLRTADMVGLAGRERSSLTAPGSFCRSSGKLDKESLSLLLKRRTSQRETAKTANSTNSMSKDAWESELEDGVNLGTGASTGRKRHRR